MNKPVELQGLFESEGLRAKRTDISAPSTGEGIGRISLARSYNLVGMPPLTELTISQLDRLTNGIANWYHAKGVKPKDPIAIFLTDDIAYLLHFLALTKIGAVPVFLDKGIESNTAIQLINELDAVAVVSEPGRLRDDWLYIRFFNPSQIMLNTDASHVHHRYIHHDEDPVLITCTVNSYGHVKPVHFKYKEFYSGIHRQRKYAIGLRNLYAFSLGEASKLATLISALIAGCIVKFIDRDESESAHLLSIISDFKPDLVASTSKTFDRIADAHLDQHDLDSVSLWLGIGGTNSAPTIQRLTQYGDHYKDVTLDRGSRFIDAFSPPSFSSSLFEMVHEPGENVRSHCLGKPFDWVKAHVFDERDKPLPAMMPGRLGIKAETALTAYWNNSLLTERERVRGYWLTGDRVYLSSDGNYYHATPD